MTQEAYDEVHRNLLMKKIDGIFEGFKGIASLSGDIVIFRYSDHLAFRICGDIMNSHELCRVISEDRKSVTWIPYSNIQYIVRSRDEYDGESIQGSEAVHNQAED